MDIPVLPYDSAFFYSDTSIPVTWQQFHAFRNEIVRALRPLGTVGPMGECPITDGTDIEFTDWLIENHDPVFYILDDQYHDVEIYVLIEIEAFRLTKNVTRALQSVLMEFPRNWSVGVTLAPIGYLSLFVDKAVIQGDYFTGVQHLEDIIERCRSYSGQT
jgi:hypothetical protein